MPDQNITVQEQGGNIQLPGQNVQLVIAPATSGPVAQLLATQDPNKLVSTYSGGPLVEAAGLSALKGGTILAMRAATVTPGAIVIPNAAVPNLSAATNATPIVCTTGTPHGLTTGNVVTVAGVTGNTNANGTKRVNVLSATTFELVGSAGNGVFGGTGTVVAGAGVFTGSGTSVVTVTGTPVDDMYIMLDILTGGTVGTSGILFRVSFDAGRHFGPQIQMGTANTFVLLGTGCTLAFAAGTLVTGDKLRFATTGPLSDTSGIGACLDVANASQYAVAGWGSTHLPSILNGADTGTVQTKLATLASTFFLYTRAITSARDAKVPTAWGGPGETETVWQNALLTDFSALTGNRFAVGGGWYNIPSPFQYQHGGSPSFRRPGSWAVAARRVAIPPQRHDGRVRDNALDNIALDPTSDPTDGFIYHDEFFNPGLTAGRFMAFKTRRGRPGLFVDQPKLMAAPGSVFELLPLGLVMDVACAIVQKSGSDYVNDDLTLNPNGTLKASDKRSMESTIKGFLDANMTNAKMISSCTVVVNGTTNVALTKLVEIAVTIVSRGYVLTQNIVIAYSNPFGPTA
jgi:hypothetical protein